MYLRRSLYITFYIYCLSCFQYIHLKFLYAAAVWKPMQWLGYHIENQRSCHNLWYRQKCSSLLQSIQQGHWCPIMPPVQSITTDVIYRKERSKCEARVLPNLVSRLKMTGYVFLITCMLFNVDNNNFSLRPTLKVPCFFVLLACQLRTEREECPDSKY